MVLSFMQASSIVLTSILDLKFLPEHCVELVEKLKEVLGEKVNHLLPDVYFKTKQHANWNISMK